MAEIIDFNLSKDEFIELADKALAGDDAEKCIIYLRKALELDERSAEASVKLAAVYNGLGAYEISNAVLYKALRLRPSEEDRNRIYLALAGNFADLNDPEIVCYYLRDFEDEYDVDLQALLDEYDSDEIFSVGYPKNDDYYELLVDKAYTAMRERDFDAALEYAAQIDPRSKSSEAKDHIILVSFMMKNDIDRVIDTAKEMLSKNDSLSVKCTLATAYLMEEKKDEAYKVLDNILSTEYTRLEEILLLLPILVNMEMHSEVVKYTKRALENLRLQPNTMIWLSQGMYNLGQHREALRIMNRVKNLYGNFSPAEYFIDLYKARPESVPYSMQLPYPERVLRFKKLEDYMRLGKADFEKALRYDAEFAKLIKWTFFDCAENPIFILMNKLETCKIEWVRELYRDILITPELTFALMSRIIFALLDGGYTLDFDVVAQDRYKNVYLQLPDAHYSLPKILRNAVEYSICDVVFTDEEPTIYLERLRNLINDMVQPAENGKLVWKNKSAEKLNRFKSVKTLVGVLLARVYFDDPDPVEDTIGRYDLNRRTFDKYYKMIFGDEDEK